MSNINAQISNSTFLKISCIKVLTMTRKKESRRETIRDEERNQIRVGYRRR
jgi:hypothetical protein